MNVAQCVRKVSGRLLAAAAAPLAQENPSSAPICHPDGLLSTGIPRRGNALLLHSGEETGWQTAPGLGTFLAALSADRWWE